MLVHGDQETFNKDGPDAPLKPESVGSATDANVVQREEDRMTAEGAEFTLTNSHLYRI